MNDLDPDHPEVVQLDKGYIDREGNQHDLVKVRAPKVRDELWAETQSRKRWEDPGELAHASFLVLACIEQWEGIADVDHDKLMNLPRRDLIKLQNKISALEDGRVAEGNAQDDGGPN